MKTRVSLRHLVNDCRLHLVKEFINFIISVIMKSFPTCSRKDARETLSQVPVEFLTVFHHGIEKKFPL